MRVILVVFSLGKECKMDVESSCINSNIVLFDHEFFPEVNDLLVTASDPEEISNLLQVKYKLVTSSKRFIGAKQYSINSMMRKSSEIQKDPASEESNVNKKFFHESLEFLDQVTTCLLGQSIYNIADECSKEKLDEYVENVDASSITLCLEDIVTIIDFL